MRLHRRPMVTALVAGLVVAGGGLAWAGPVDGRSATAAVAPRTAPAQEPPAQEPPAGWTIAPLAAGLRLTWRPARPVPMGDAAIRFFAGNRLLGTPRPPADGSTFVLDVPAAAVPDPADLRVLAAGRRLDVTPTATPRVGPPPVPAVLPAAEVDPGRPGQYATVTGEYTLPTLTLPGLAAPVEQQGLVVAPQGAPGNRPLVLFLHGRHQVCYGGTQPEQTWPCPAGTAAVPSYQGYQTAQRLLASQGYLTVSIAANGINGQDGQASDGGSQARSALVRSHLGHWADWAGTGRAGAPPAVRAAPPADLDKVLLVGHSRGGEGVNRAVLDSLAPPPPAVDGYRGAVRWRIRGTYLLAPTAFGQNPAADVPSLVLLPGCDGDVADLQGQVYVDGTRGVSRGEALHSAAFVVGANHNYFNSEWTPGQATAPAVDDWPVPDDQVCGTGAQSQRLTPAQQQAVGATYAAAAARLFVEGDDDVRPLLDGTGVRAPSADPARVRSHALGAARNPLLTAGPDLAVTATGASRVRVCAQVAPLGDAASCQVPGPDFFRSPHEVGFFGLAQEPDRHAVLLDWTAPDGVVALQPAAPAALTGAQAVALRLAVPPNTPTTTLDVALVDGAGRRAVLGPVSLAGLPGTVGMPAQWAQEARVPLAAATAAGLDLGRIARVELTPRGATGRAWLIDAWGWRAGTPEPRAVALPRIDVQGLVDVREGDSGVRTYQLPIAVSGSGSGQLRLFVVIPATSQVSHQVVTVAPGTTRLTVPIEVAGNTRYGFEKMQYLVLAKSVQDTVVGGYEGHLAVLNDDPRPAVTATPVADRVTEGTPLRWRLDLSAPADVALSGQVTALAPATGPELSTADVDPQWLKSAVGVDPAPVRALSAAGGTLRVTVAAGAREAVLEVPTVADGVTEPPETLRLSVDWAGQRVELVGTVSDQP